MYSISEVFPSLSSWIHLKVWFLDISTYILQIDREVQSPALVFMELFSGCNSISYSGNLDWDYQKRFLCCSTAK